MRAIMSEHFALDRPTPVLEDAAIEKIRVRHWFFYVARYAIEGAVDAKNRLLWEAHVLGPDPKAQEIKLVRHLHQWITEDAQLAKLREDQLRIGSNLKAAKYEEGATSPNEFTIALIESLVPGSRTEYEYGPKGEPLWVVLAGKVNACEEYVSQCFSPDELMRTDLRDRVQLVMNALIAPAYRVHASEILELGAQKKTAHPVWLTHINELTKLPNEELGHEGLEVATIDDQIILAIALWHIAASRQEKVFHELEWLVMGLCFGVIAHHFTEDIQAYVLTMLREKGNRMPYSRGGQFVSYDERWTATFTG
jgi:hypothetical protein